MCFEKIFSLFKSQAALALPHLEEPKNPSATLENTDITKTVERWLYGWEVPVVYYPFWQTEVSIVASLQYPYPAATFAETKQMFIRPEWASPGVLAHEAAHISYSLLTEGGKTAFESSYTALLKTDPLLRLLDAQNSYMNTNAVEAHAEIYRYLGRQMPAVLQSFYPELI